MELLFSYGTLQQDNVQQQLFGRLLTGTKDVLVGYTLGEIAISDEEVVRKSGKAIHPILKYSGQNEDEVEGTLFELTSNELKQADSYEVKEYKRVEAVFKSGIKAWIYADANQ